MNKLTNLGWIAIIFQCISLVAHLSTRLFIFAIINWIFMIIAITSFTIDIRNSKQRSKAE